MKRCEKKRRFVCLGLLLLVIFILFPFSASAAEETEQYIEIEVPREIEEYMPRDLEKTDVSEIYRSFDFDFFTGAILKILATAVPGAAQDFALLLGLLIVAACLGALRNTVAQPALKTAMELVSMLCVAGAVFSATESVFSLAESFLSSLSVFMGTVTPTMAALMAASGNVTSAAVMSGVITCALAVLESIAAGVLFPMIRLCLCLSAISSVFGMTGLGGIVPLIKKVITYVFGFVTLCLSAVLTFQSIISKSADSLAIKGIKFAVGTFIPVVGSAVNEALSTMAGGIGTIKAATGVVGAVSVCMLAALPVVQILVHKLFLELASVCAGVLGLNAEGKLVTDIASFLGSTAAVMAISAVFFVLALSMMAAAGV